MKTKTLIPLMLASVLVAGLIQGCAPLVIGGAATGLGMAHDRRTTGTIVEDQEIELHAMEIKLNDSSYEGHSNVSATSYNMVLLLTGQVDDPVLSSRYEAEAGQIGRVKRVVNEITIGPFSTFGRKTKDAYITSKAKVALFRVKTEGFDPTRVKVVTEQGAVYLMGLMTRDEAHMVTEEIRRISGVTKVVKVFEYIQPN